MRYLLLLVLLAGCSDMSKCEKNCEKMDCSTPTYFCKKYIDYDCVSQCVEKISEIKKKISENPDLLEQAK